MENKTEKLFYIDQYAREFTCNVVEIIEKVEEFHLILDKTAFFPGGGGQVSDLGTIDGKEVINVYEEAGTIYHVLKDKPKKLENIKCIINWERRFDGMQQHLAQHVLSGCFFNLFNANTVSIHLGSDISTVDIMGFLEENQIYDAEKMANKMICDRLKVEMIVPSKQEIKKMKLRRALPKSNEEIRVVKIENLDINACCGVHPNSTFDLQILKIKRWEKNKGNTRIEFVAGSRAIADCLEKDKILSEVCRFLNAGEQEIVNSIKNLSDSLKVSNEESRKLKTEVAKYELENLMNSGKKIGNIDIITKIYKDENMKYLNRLAADITAEEDRIVLFGALEKGKCNLLFACSKNIKKISMGDLLKDAITLVDGRGGGNDYLAQGGGKNSSNIESVMEYAMRKISDINKG